MRDKMSDKKGFTLIELMVGLGLAGVVFLIMMTLMGQSAKFAAFFNGTATSIAGVSDAVTQLNSVMSQVVQVDTCNCRGGGQLNSMSNCTWSDAQPWYNPVLNGSASNSAHGEHGAQLMTGYFESWFGGANNSLTDGTDAVKTDFINALSFSSGLGGCEDFTALPSAKRRGCKMKFALYYKAPEIETGAALTQAAKAGSLTLHIGDQAIGSGDGVVKFGNSDGNGAGGLGVTELACGFNNSSSGTAGLLFVLNFKIKARSTTLLNSAHPNYESWYPNVTAVSPNYSGSSGKNYAYGLFRNVKLNFAFRNLGTRGLYHWRSSSVKGCVANGDPATAAEKQKCCSLASNGTQCVACVPGGVAGTNDTCCSEKAVAGTCI